MNSCTLLLKITSAPELRFTPEEQTPVCSLVGEFSQQEHSSKIRVTAWRKLAESLSESYTQGEFIVVSGRLAMKTVQNGDRKTKVAELVASRIVKLPSPAPGDRNKVAARPSVAPVAAAATAKDDIPF